MCSSSPCCTFKPPLLTTKKPPQTKTKTPGRNKDFISKSNFSTWDPRKLGKAGGGDPLGPQYDEIPYGDVPPPHIAATGRGMLPEVPAEYSQVPMVPARQGKNFGGCFPLFYIQLSNRNKLYCLSLSQKIVTYF